MRREIYLTLLFLSGIFVSGCGGSSEPTVIEQPEPEAGQVDEDGTWAEPTYDE